MKRSISRCMLAALLALGTAACSGDFANAGGGRSDDHVTLNIQLSVDARPTRAMSETMESALDIYSLRVMVFDENNRLAYIAPYIIRSTSAISAQLRTSRGLEKYRVTVVANTQQGKGMTLQELEAGIGTLTYDQIAARYYFDVQDKWQADDTRLIPLWGEYEPMVIKTGMSIDTLPLLRALARVDIGIDLNDDGTLHVPTNVANFQMNTIRLFGSKKRGWMMPLIGSVSNTGTATAEALQPSLRAYVESNGLNSTGYDAVGNVGGLDYSSFIPGERRVFNEIYIAESEAFPADSACFVIGGKFNPDPVGNPTWDGLNTTYYRVDFRDVNQGGATAPVLRNHRYLFNIASVTGPGLPTVEEALKSIMLNMRVNVRAWNEFSLTGDIDNVVPMKISLSGLDMGTGINYTRSYNSFRNNGYPYLYPAYDPTMGAGYDQERLIWNIAVVAYREDGGAGAFDEVLSFDRFDAVPASHKNDLYVDIHRRSYNRRLVAIANVGMGANETALANALKTTTFATLPTFLRQTCTQTNKQMLWNYLPFCGVSRVIAPGEIREGATAAIDIKMLCSAARLDVGINYTDITSLSAAGQTSGSYPFFLRAVYVVNYQQQVSPIPTLSTAAIRDAVSSGAISASTSAVAGTMVQASTAANMLQYAVDYPLNASPKPTHALLRSIYLPETASATTTLIIKGGTSNTDPANDTYYKVILNNRLLRNHRYVLNLSNITGSGATTPEAALNGTPINATATILTWENTVVDLPNMGQYTLKVVNKATGKATHTIARNATLTITTNYPTWQVLNASKAVVKSGVRGTYDLVVNTANGFPTVGSYTIKSGSIEWALIVQ